MSDSGWPKSPDCRDGNHGKCPGEAWDMERDEETPCECPCHHASYEAEAARLYGPAPTGDEDPHASQAVPDPGRDSGPYTFPAQLLSGIHLGMRVRVSEQRGVTRYGLQGTLVAVDHYADQISERALCTAEDHPILGRRHVRVTLLHAVADTFQPEATVELLD